MMEAPPSGGTTSDVLQQQSEPLPPARPSGGDGPSGPRAGFWIRFGALLLDGVIAGVVILVLTLALKGVGYALGLIGVVAYFVMLEGGPTGQTLGKRAMGIRVISFEDGGPIGYGRAFIRTIGRWVSSLVIYIGYLWMLWDKERQTWHDKFANSVVVPERDYPVPRS
jgi:uncharacterized RDD family membrane protein YckC